MTEATIHSLSDQRRANSFLLRPPYDTIEINRKLTLVDRKLLNYMMINTLPTGSEVDAVQTIERSTVYKVVGYQTDEVVDHVFKNLITTSVKLKNQQDIRMGMFLSSVSLTCSGVFEYRPVFVDEINWHSGEPGTQAVITGESTNVMDLEDFLRNI